MRRKNLAAIGISAALALTAVATVFTCGDKYLVPGRGVRFQPTPAERQKATVLFYAPPASALGRTLSRLQADAALRKVGYRPTLATTPGELARAASASWDVVLVGSEDAAAISRELRPDGRAHLVAVLNDETAVQVSAAKAAFPAVLRSPARNQDFLDALDAAAGRAYADRVRAVSKR